MRLAATIFVAIHGIGHVLWFFSTWTQPDAGEGRTSSASHLDPGVPVALAIEVVLHGFVRAVCVVAASLRRRCQAAIIPPRPSATLFRVGADLLVGVRRRAPPTPLPS